MARMDMTRLDAAVARFGDADTKAPTEADAYDHGEADGYEGRKSSVHSYNSNKLMAAYVEGYARGKRARGDSEQTGKVVLHDGKWWYRKPNDTLRHGPYASGSEASSGPQERHHPSQ